MKYPVKPYAPTPPTKTIKTDIEICKIDLDIWSYSTIEEFNNKILDAVSNYCDKHNPSISVSDVRISFKNEKYLILMIQLEVDNKDYNKLEKQYQENLAKYKKEQINYKENMKKYTEWQNEQLIKREEKEFERLKKKLNR